MEVLGGTATLTSQVSGSQGRVGGGGFSDSLAPPKEKQRWFLKEMVPILTPCLFYSLVLPWLTC